VPLVSEQVEVEGLPDSTEGWEVRRSDSPGMDGWYSPSVNCQPAEPDGDYEQDDGGCYQNELTLAYWKSRSECPFQLGEDVG
jgi:hypothetical protein